MNETVFRVANVDEIRRAFRRTRDAVSRGAEAELISFARPVANDAAVRATGEITGIRREKQAPTWAAMRVGTLVDAVYIAPVRRGRRSRRNDAVRRPNLKQKLLNEAMVPAAVANEPKLRAKFQKLLDQAADVYARGS